MDAKKTEAKDAGIKFLRLAGFAAIAFAVILIIAGISGIKKTQKETAAETMAVQAQKNWPLCADARNIDFPRGVEKMTMLTRAECWAGYVTVPADWPQYYVHSISNNGFEMFYLDGTSVWAAPDTKEWREDLRNKKGVFRIRGEGPIVVSRDQ